MLRAVRNWSGVGMFSSSYSFNGTCSTNTVYGKCSIACVSLAIARLSCSTCFVRSIRNKLKRNCRRVDWLVSPSWFVAEITGDPVFHQSGCSLRSVRLQHFDDAPDWQVLCPSMHDPRKLSVYISLYSHMIDVLGRQIITCVYCCRNEM